MLSKRLMVSSENQASMQMTATESRIFDKRIIEQLQAKMFTPHLISNSMALSFQESNDDGNLLSLMEIMKIFSEDNKQFARFYFKFCPEEYEDYLGNQTLKDRLEVHKVGGLRFNNNDTNPNSKEQQ